MFSKRWKRQHRKLMQTTEKNGPHSYITSAGLSDLRIVLLGTSSSGKSSVGNTLLSYGQEVSVFKAGEERTTECDSRRGVIAGRHITVVDTPGWYYNSPLRDTAEVDKLEIQSSVGLCPPGPHVALLTVPVDRAFTKTMRVALEEHMTLLSQNVWSHAIVLFTYGDMLGHTSIEHHIEAEGEDLCWLVDKCGNRYHVFNNEKHDDTQIMELAEKMEELLVVNRGGYYENDREVLRKLSERMRNIEEDARTFLRKTQKNADDLKVLFEGEDPDELKLPDVRLMLVGGQQNDRSAAGNKILHQNLFTETPYKEFISQNKLTQCVRQGGRVADRNISVVISPDWSSTTPPSQKTKDVLLHGVKTLSSPGLHALLVTVDLRARFSEDARRSVQEHMELLGDRFWRDAVVLFMWGWWMGDRHVEDYIESEGEALRWLLDKCDYRYHVLNGKKCDVSEVTELLEQVDYMVMLNKMWREREERRARTQPAVSAATASERGNSDCRSPDDKKDSDRLPKADPGPIAPSSGCDTTSEAPAQTDSDVKSSSGSEITTPEKVSTKKERKRYRVQLEAGGTYECAYTGLVFEARERVEVTYSVLAWSQFNALVQSPWMVEERARNPFMIAGPMFNVHTVNPSALKSVQLPHAIRVVEGEKMFGVLHITGQDPDVKWSVVW